MKISRNLNSGEIQICRDFGNPEENLGNLEENLEICKYGGEFGAPEEMKKYKPHIYQKVKEDDIPGRRSRNESER